MLIYIKISRSYTRKYSSYTRKYKSSMLINKYLCTPSSLIKKSRVQASFDTELLLLGALYSDVELINVTLNLIGLQCEY